jgi:hypothetical protein
MCPRISKRGGKLVACTAWRLRILALGLLYRRVVVDPEAKQLEIYRRYLWLFSRRRQLPFEKIEAVTYAYQDWAGGASYSAHDSLDLYEVGLWLDGGDGVHLFYFFGEGIFTNNGPFPDWWYWNNSLFKPTGTQDTESLVFVNLLSKLIGVSVVPGWSG